MDDALAKVVGDRIRRLRTREGISLRRQAQLLDLAPSALSALENGRGGVSLSALQRIGAHFGLAIHELLATPSVPDAEHGALKSEVFRLATSPIPTISRGTGTLYQLLGDGKGHPLQPYTMTFLPGGGFPNDQMSHAGEAFTYVVVGEVEVLYGDETHRLRQGDVIRFRTETPHSFRNASESSVAIIVGAATPPW